MRIGGKQLAALALAAMTLAASGCGSSAKPLTRAELTAKADAICKTVTARLAKNTIRTQQDIARVAGELAAFEQVALTNLSKLVPPAALADDWKQFVAGAQTLAENTSKIGEYAKANNLKASKSLITSSQATQRQMTAIAKRDGLRSCEPVP
jgi:uncharacterized protein with von Willebrand factor type A (vWA) domain